MKSERMPDITDDLAETHNKSFFREYKESKKSGHVFDMHSYWTKQPIEVIADCIYKFTKPGDRVLDCFSGTGMTGLASMINGRNAILMDVSPVCCHISQGYCSTMDKEKATSEFQRIDTAMQKRIADLYSTECLECGNEAVITFSILGEVAGCRKCGNQIGVGGLNLEKMRADSPLKDYVCSSCETVYKNKRKLAFSGYEPLELVYLCDACKSGKMRKVPAQVDMDNFSPSNLGEFWYPNVGFFGNESKRNHSKGIFNTYQMFSKRNLHALSALYDLIKEIEDQDIKSFFLFVFTSIVFNVSLMSIYRKYENTAIKMGTLYIPSMIKDSNVILSFRRKFKRILAAKEKIFRNAEELGDVEILNVDAAHYCLPEESIDYVYIDPPYSDIISYSQLNIMWESWLKSYTRRRDEIILNDSEGKGKDFYLRRMTGVFRNLHRALKTNHFLTLVFHHPEPSHWRMIQEIIRSSGFQPWLSDRPSVIRSSSRTASQLATKKLTQGFLLMDFKKPAHKFELQLAELSPEEYHQKTLEIIEEGLKAGYKRHYELYDYLIHRLFPDVWIADFDKEIILSHATE